MEKEIKVFNAFGIIVAEESWYNQLKEDVKANNFDDILNGKYMLATEEQIEFFNNHPDYDVYHLFYMKEYTEEDIRKEKELKNNSIKETRERLYKAESDSIYMSFIKYSALGRDDKAKEAYDQWLAKVKQIEEENTYIK